MTPLLGETGWCRYPVAQFMECSGISQCQYPYPSCDSVLGLCTAAGITDPIENALLPLKFRYRPVGVNVPALPVGGLFFAASFPTSPPEVDNATGGKLIKPYEGFLRPPAQFAGATEFAGNELVTFSKLTAFCVVSLAPLAKPVGPPQIPYHTAIYEDPQPVLAMSSIIPGAVGDNPRLWVSFFRESSDMKHIRSRMFVPVGTEPLAGPVADTWMWNPAAIVPSLAVQFVSNPIVTPWVNIIPRGSNAIPPIQSSFAHTLIYSGGYYKLGLVFINLLSDRPLDERFYASAVVDIPLSPTTDLVVTSWDAITTWLAGDDYGYTTVLLYGLNLRSSGGNGFGLYAFQITFNALGSENQLPILSLPVIPRFVSLPADLVLPSSHFRLSRAMQQGSEPLLTLTCFSLVSKGVQLTSYLIRTNNENFNLTATGNSCTGEVTLEGITALRYVSSITGAYNYGSFVLWVATSHARSAFVIAKVNALCESGQFGMAVMYSTVYWRRLTGELVDTYHMYPIGGGSLPFFLATDTALTFDGVPHLTPPAPII